MKNTFYWALLISFCLLIPSASVVAQINPERTAINRLLDGKWESANRLLRKSLHKDTSNLEALYVTARWFFAKGSPYFNIDSAAAYTNKSLYHFKQLSPRDAERAKKFPLDSSILLTLKEQIDSAAFERSKKINTETAYITFIKKFSSAIQVPNAIELRDEVSFMEALKINSYQSFNDYRIRYPNSHRAIEAIARYEKLLFDDKTKSKKLNEFKKFILEYPASPYAKEARKQVFEISTASSTPEDFYSYLKEYPTDTYNPFIRDILFHVYKERDEEIPAQILNDSLKRVVELDKYYWVPYLKNNLFGFMNQTGEEVMHEQFRNVPDLYKCSPVLHDILSLSDGHFSRTGKLIADSTATLRDIGVGFLEKNSGGCKQLIHKSGRIIISACYDDYKMIAENFIGASRGDQFFLYTLAGRALPVKGVTNAEEIEGLIVLTRYGKKILTTKTQLAKLANNTQGEDELVFDEVKLLDNNLLLVRNSGLEGILNTQMKFVVPFERHTLYKLPFGLVQKQNGRSTLRGWSPALENKVWDRISYHKNWLLLENTGTISLYDLTTKTKILEDADSVWFDRSLTYVKKQDQLKVYVTSSRVLDVAPDSKINFVTSRDSVQFFFTERKKKKTVFSLDKGDQLFTTEFDLVESLGTEYFLVSNGIKNGILARSGKLVVPIEMDAIINVDNQLSLLKDKKFGLFDLRLKRYIKPEYERNIMVLNGNLIVFKKGAYGLLSQEGKPVSGFDYSDIKPWTDSLVWAKRATGWELFNVFTHKVELNKVAQYSEIRNYGSEKLAIVLQNQFYGIFSSRKGLILAPAFSQIMNLGTPDEPFYFTENYMEETDTYSVAYYTREGKLIRTLTYIDADYERIFCEED